MRAQLELVSPVSSIVRSFVYMTVSRFLRFAVSDMVSTSPSAEYSHE